MAQPYAITVIIVGCGLGGLTCAVESLRHDCRVIILEKSPEILAIGAGIMVPPNAVKVLRHFGLDKKMPEKGAIEISGARFLTHAGELLYVKEGANMIRDYGDPWCVMHRAEYHGLLYEEALRLGAEIRLGCEVGKIEMEGEASVAITTDGERVEGDVVIGADGLWSNVRNHVLGRHVPPEPTGDLAYRMTLSGAALANIADGNFQEFLKADCSTVWLGSDRHCVFYPIRNKTAWNLVLLRPDNLAPGVRTQKTRIEDVQRDFESWDPRLRKLLETADSVLSWKLLHMQALETWVKGRVVLLGDACHPSLPYQAQGAAMALEDGITLGLLLGSLAELKGARRKELLKSIPAVLALYQTLRKDRTEFNQKGSVSNRSWYHAKHGEDMEHRNAVFRSAMVNEKSEWKGADPDYQIQLLGFDAYAVARRAFSDWKEANISGANIISQ